MPQAGWQQATDGLTRINMKRVLFLTLYLLILCPLLFAGGITDKLEQVTARKKVAGGNGCDDCSGTLKFSWHMENVDVTLGTPCGCSDGDTTATANDSITLSDTQEKDGTYSAYAADAGKYYSFTGSAEDLVDMDEALVIFWVYITTWAEDAHLFEVFGNANENEI